MELMFQPLRKYADFEGRARRMEYWLFAVFHFLILIAVGAIFGIVAVTTSDANGETTDAGSAVLVAVMLIGVAIYLGLLIPSLAVLVRRLHDSDKSGWWILIGLVPMGGLVTLIFTFLDGTSGSNRFGPDPKATPQSVF